MAVVCRSLVADRCSLRVARCLVCDVDCFWCVLFVVHCLGLVVCWSLLAVRCSLVVVC